MANATNIILPLESKYMCIYYIYMYQVNSKI